MSVERPHAGWWVAIPGGLGALALVAFHPGAYAFWTAHVTGLLSAAFLQRVFVVSVLLHVGEALWAARLARRAGLAGATGWFWQTLALGFPSLRLLRRQVRHAT